MNPLSKKKLIQMGLDSTRQIAIAAGNEIYIEHYKAFEIRSPMWVVQHREQLLKTFKGRRNDKSALNNAINWAVGNYSLPSECERDPFGGWHPVGTLARAVAAKSGEYS